ncbi:hypothetical protein LAZ67_10002979 [Cordylochernes scorpioides]|uniref:Peptidase S1 domain-containing protein n=1 Tax=Cordylochernes scorpioides TaxID=51811 RepID=A0ABY6KWZ7_9ARAC|nr:hypothetical protein LAZ67_10002979 [Cordylochernes scorpioides]
MCSPLFVLPQPSVWKVRLGEHNLKQQDPHERHVAVSVVHYYPWYKGYDQDLALMRLVDPIESSDHIRPLCLPSATTTNFTDKTCMASGWGKLDFGNNFKASDVLRVVDVKIYENDVCDRAYRPRFRIPIQQWHLCAGRLENGVRKGTCQGDSGGPLQCQINGRWTLAGLTSFGSGCAKPGFPDVYTRVSHYLSWIKQTTGMQ